MISHCVKFHNLNLFYIQFINSNKKYLFFKYRIFFIIIISYLISLVILINLIILFKILLFKYLIIINL